MATTNHYDLDSDSLLGGNSASDLIIPSQKAVKTYVDNNSGGGGSSTLSGLTDVTLTSPSSGEVLSYDGSDWVNKGLKTINSQSIVGSGNIAVQSPLTAGDNINITGGYGVWNIATQISVLSNLPYWSSAYGNGTFVIINDDGYISTSTDGTTWTTPTQEFSQQHWIVRYGNNKFVAINHSGYVSTSTDGTTWTTPTLNSNLNNYQPWYEFAFDGNKFIAISAYGYVSTSTDGDNWSTVISTNLGYREWDSLAYNGVNYVAISPNGYVSTSTDGETWSSPTQDNELSSISLPCWFTMTYDGNKFIVLSYNGYTSTSTDGITWTTPVLQANLGNRGWSDFASDGNRIIAFGDYGYISTSESSQVISAENEIFVAEYGTTTYAEVLSAYNAGKMIFCKYSSYDELYTCSGLLANAVLFSYSRGTGSSYVWILDNNTWNNDSVTLAKTDVSNLTNTGNIAVSNLAMPSGTSKNVTLGASGTEYTAPSNGWYTYAGNPAATGRIQFTNSDASLYDSRYSPSGGWLGAFIPVAKGQKIKFYYDGNFSPAAFKFVYAIGSESEYS